MSCTCEKKQVSKTIYVVRTPCEECLAKMAEGRAINEQIRLQEEREMKIKARADMNVMAIAEAELIAEGVI